MEKFFLNHIHNILKEWKWDIEKKIQNPKQKEYALSNWAEWKIYFGNNGKDKPMYKADYEAQQEADKFIKELKGEK